MTLIRTAACTVTVLLILSACDQTKVAAPVVSEPPADTGSLEGAVIGSDGLVP